MTSPDSPSPTVRQHLITLAAWVTIVLTIALPLGEALASHLNSPHSPSSSTLPTQTTSPTPSRPSTSKADKAAAHRDGCRQQTSTTTGNLISRPSCRSGMPVTRDHMTQAPDTSARGAHPTPMNEVPPAWADHWGAAAHSPHHRSQA